MTVPSLHDVREKLRALLAGECSRDEASDWAAQWLAAHHPGVEDSVVWRALEGLGAANLKAGPDTYLYFEPDFHAWLDEVENAIDARR